MVLGEQLKGFGNGSVSGATRGKITEALEDLRAKVLVKLLEQVRPISTRAAKKAKGQSQLRLASGNAMSRYSSF